MPLTAAYPFQKVKKACINEKQIEVVPRNFLLIGCINNCKPFKKFKSLFLAPQSNGMHQSLHSSSAYLITIFWKKKYKQQFQSTRNSENFRFDGRNRSRHDCCWVKHVINFFYIAAIADKMTCCACDTICTLRHHKRMRRFEDGRCEWNFESNIVKSFLNYLIGLKYFLNVTSWATIYHYLIAICKIADFLFNSLHRNHSQ